MDIRAQTLQGAQSRHDVLREMGVPASCIFSGTDYPFVGKRPLGETVLQAPFTSGLYSQEELEGIKGVNALHHFPRCRREWTKAGLTR